MRDDQNRDLDKRLRAVDGETRWNPEHRARLGKRISDGLDKEGTTPVFARKMLGYYAALVTAAVIAVLLLGPVVLPSDGPDGLVSGDRMSGESVPGYELSVVDVHEEDSGYAVTVVIENSGEQYIKDSGFFVKDFGGDGFDVLGPDVHQSGLKDVEDGEFADPHSALLNTWPDDGSLDVIGPGESVEVLFHVNGAFAESDDFEVMYESKLAEEPEYGGALYYHVIDLENEVAGQYDQGESGGGEFVVYGVLALVVLAGIFVVFRVARTRAVRIEASLAVIVLVVGGYYLFSAFADGERTLEEAVDEGIPWPMVNVVHTEMLEHDEAVVFYEWGGGRQYHFGAEVYEKTALGWSGYGGGSGQVTGYHRAGIGYSNLEMRDAAHMSLSHGYIVDDNVARVVLVMDDQEYEGEIVEFGDGRRFWYYVSDEVNLGAADVRLYDEDGEELENRVEWE